MDRGVVDTTGPDDEQVRLLLVLYRCPVPFHIVRTRILGSIASPNLDVSPIETVKSLWGEDSPEFGSTASLNELMEALVKGVWNRLARHKQRRVPFRLLRIDVPLDREGLGRLALVRREELEGFVEGLFGPKEELDIPERAHRALDQLSEIREFLWTVQEVRFDAIDPATQAEITNMLGTLGTLGTLTRIAEHEIHEAVLSCTRARRGIQEPGMGSGAMPFVVGIWRQPFSRGRITLTTRPELRMGVVTSAQHHWDRAAQFRRHAEHARLPETREMYLRLARAEDAMAEMASDGNRTKCSQPDS